MRLAALAPLVAVALLSGCFGSGSEGESRQLPGPAWTGQGTEGISQTEAEAFADFGLYWWGPSFAGFNLQAILVTPGQVTFIYGRCTIPRGRDGGCPAPLSIMIQPVCALSPQIVGQAYPTPEEAFREGAVLLLRYIPERGEATATFWTGDAMVRLHVGGAALQFDESLEAIRGLNRSVGPGDPLPPPEFERCTQ